MSKLYSDSQGKLCIAKIIFMLSVAVCLYKIIVGDVPDYQGMAIFLSPIGAVYWGRNHDKKEKT